MTKPSQRYQYQRAQRTIIWPLAIVPFLLATAAYLVSTEHFVSVQATLRTDRFIRQLDGLLDTVQDAETGQRGYLLTHDRKYLQPFQGAKNRLKFIWPRLIPAANSARVSQEIAAIHRLIDTKLAEMQGCVDLEDAHHHDQALRQLLSGEGLRLMLDIRERVDTLREEQARTFEERLAHQRHLQAALNIVLGLGVLISSALVFAKFSLNSLYRRERDAIEDEIRSLNTSLEARVAERTKDLQARTAELERRSEELERSNRDLTQFAYIASHDLQEPLRTVASYTGLLQYRYKNKLDPEANEFIAFAIDGVERMRLLVNDILTYARAGTQRLTCCEILPSKFVDAALANLALTIYENSVTVNCTLPTDTVFADEIKMAQVVQNLLENAVKFRKADPPLVIDITARKLNGKWLFAIKDNGVGFEQKYAQRIMQPFQRLHGPGVYPGSGIGLAVCARIIEHHGGKLWAESTPGEGATFFFTLPAHA